MFSKLNKRGFGLFCDYAVFMAGGTIARLSLTLQLAPGHPVAVPDNALINQDFTARKQEE